VLGIETDQWLTSVIYFDDEYQTIQSIADLYPSGIEITSNDHDFMGNVIQTKVKQTIGSNVYEYNKWFDFDSYGRLQQVSQQITGDNTNNKVILAKYTYDELGNIATKAIHNEKQTESYTYDLTGRTISVTSPSFSYALDYEESPISSAIPRLDGNICAMRWGSSTTPNKAYTYTYDHVGQLQSADYKLLSNNVWNNSSNYKEGGLTYDLNGNILTVQRTNSSGAQLHNIAYTYEGYRLKTVNVNNVPSAAYAYDSNGNITSDGRRGVTINYNILNFPEQIIAGNQQVSYIYSAAGEKLATNANGSLTYYRSVMVYGNDNKLLHILTTEGTVTRTEGSAGTSYTYNYFKKDRIGSTRAVLSAVGNTLQNVQSTDYYPFGLAYSTNNLNKNKYLFSGKELQDASIGGTILGLYDFGARQYDPVIGRWMTQDILSKNYAELSPYSYCANNPINLVDLNGMKIDSLSEEKFESLLRMFQHEQRRANQKLDQLSDHEWQSTGMKNRISSLEARTNSIQSTLDVMDIMRSSSQIYAIKKISTNELGGLFSEPRGQETVIFVKYGTRANFVHELVHVMQFEEGRIAFSEDGAPMFNDIYKEVEAYQMQWAYNPSSVTGLRNAHGPFTVEKGITAEWVQGLYDINDEQPYKPGGYANVAVIPLDRNSTLKDLVPAYPNQGYHYAPDADLNANLFDFFNTYYKHKSITK